MAQHSVLEYEYKLAVAEFESFLEFTDTIEGNEIPDDLYETAVEIFGAGLAKSIGEGIVKFAKKIWEIIVRIVTWIGDIIVKVFRRLGLDTKRLEQADKVLAKGDTAQFDNNLKTLTRFTPDKQEFINVSQNLAILYSFNKNLIGMIEDQGMDHRDFTEAVASLGCLIKGVVGKDSAGESRDEMKLYINDYKHNVQTAWDRGIYMNVLKDMLNVGVVEEGVSWTTLDLRAALRSVINANKQGLSTYSMNLMVKAQYAAKQWIDEANSLAGDAQNNEVLDKSRKLVAYAGDMVKLISDIYQLELTVTDVCTNVVSRMAAHAISPGSLDLGASTPGKSGANTGERNPLLALRLFSIM